jgi:hypothetical protein
MNISGSLPAEDYEEWTYTTASGVTVDISLGQSFAVMLADGPDSHTTITVGRGSEAAENPYVEDYRQAVEGQVADGLMTQEQAAQELSDYEARWSQEHGVITPAQLEAIADSIDFALVAQLGPHGEAERQACLAQKEADDTAYRQSLSDEAGYDGTLTADILEGYELQVDDGLTAEENGGTMMVVRIWETSEGGQIVLEYETMGAGDLVSDGDEPTETTDALGVEAYFVYNENFSEPNRLVWRDEAKGLDFTISSNGGLTAQQMLQQAQRLLADNS